MQHPGVDPAHAQEQGRGAEIGQGDVGIEPGQVGARGTGKQQGDEADRGPGQKQTTKCAGRESGVAAVAVRPLLGGRGR